MGRDQPLMSANPSHNSFNPRARMGRDTRMTIATLSMSVSTHAPAWGATHPCRHHQP